MDEKKNYNTKCKSLIASFLKKSGDRRVSAADVYNHLLKSGCQANRTTVYRNLEKMTEQGSVIKYKTSDSECALYQMVSEHEHSSCHDHLHLQCESCGKIIHLECEFMHMLSEHLLEDHGFVIKCSGSVLLGRCKDCAK